MTWCCLAITFCISIQDWRRGSVQTHKQAAFYSESLKNKLNALRPTNKLTDTRKPFGAHWKYRGGWFVITSKLLIIAHAIKLSILTSVKFCPLICSSFVWPIGLSLLEVAYSYNWWILERCLTYGSEMWSLKGMTTSATTLTMCWLKNSCIVGYLECTIKSD